MNVQDTNAQIDTLLAQMTAEEKVAQMVLVPCNMVTEEEARIWAKRGAGGFLHTWGEQARNLQSIACSTRASIPALFGIDAIHGHGLNQQGTIFPSQLAAACSWDRDGLAQMARATAREVAADGAHRTFSPVLCLARDTRWGRIDETFGEDPYLVGELGAAMIRGYQGDDPRADDSVLACAKHYIGYGEAVGARDSCDTQVSFRKVREVFLPPFIKAVKAGCATFMTAYGSLDGIPCTTHQKLLKDVLRGELGFDGIVVTDWDNVKNLVCQQAVCRDIDEASVTATNAGNDMIMTSLDFYEAAMQQLDSGRLEMAVIDEAVRHILTIKLRMGLLENTRKQGKPEWIGCKQHHQLAAQLARDSLVLLRNDGMLPLKAKSVALIGANADDLLAQYGDWTYFSHPDQHLDRAGVPPYVTLRQGLVTLGQQLGVQVGYAKGCGVLASKQDDQWMAEALKLAQKSEAIVLAVGDCYELLGESKDRADLALSGRQQELYAALHKLGKPICVVLISSKPLCLGAMAEEANALLTAFNGGMFGGQAVAEALLGINDPCGKLPISFPRHSGQLPVYYNALPGWHGGKYADLPATPQFVFGEGLSYTSFALKDVRFDPASLRASLHVENTGKRVGSTVVQVYFHDLVSTVLTPIKQLIAFEKVSLAPCENKEVCFQLCREDFALVLPDETRVTESGDFVLMIGTSSKDEDLIRFPFHIA